MAFNSGHLCGQPGKGTQGPGDARLLPVKSLERDPGAGWDGAVPRGLLLVDLPPRGFPPPRFLTYWKGSESKERGDFGE